MDGLVTKARRRASKDFQEHYLVEHPEHGICSVEQVGIFQLTLVKGDGTKVKVDCEKAKVVKKCRFNSRPAPRFELDDRVKHPKHGICRTVDVDDRKRLLALKDSTGKLQSGISFDDVELLTLIDDEYDPEWERRNLDDVRESRGYARLPKGLWRILEPDELVLLVALIDWSTYRMQEKVLESSKGWFYYSRKAINNQLPWCTPFVQKRLLASLQLLGFIKCRMKYSHIKKDKKFKNHRMIRIDYRRIRSVLPAKVEWHQLSSLRSSRDEEDTLDD